MFSWFLFPLHSNVNLVGVYVIEQVNDGKASHCLTWKIVWPVEE